MSAKSDYNYKTGFENWKENQEFELQNIAMSQSPLESTPVDTKRPDAKIPAMEPITIGAKM